MNINSASRILNILRAADEYEGTNRCHEVWGDVFEIDEDDRNRRNLEISRCLQLVNDELDLIRKEMRFDEIDEFNCEDILKDTYIILAVHTLMGEWKDLKRYLTREVYLCLGYCREVLPHEEDLINEEDIDEINLILESLKEKLASSSLSEYIKKIINNHVLGIEKSLHSYKIVGVSALQGTMNNIIGEVISKEGVFQEAKGTEEISTFGRLVSKVQSVSEKVVKTEKFLSSGQKIIQHSSKAIEFIDGLIVVV